MNLTYCNVTAEDGDVTSEEPLSFGMTFHHFGLLLCIIFSAIAVVVSLFTIFMHATHYARPSEQRYIIRILFMVPIYAVVSFLSFAFWRHSVYFEVIRDCYEAFAIASFFSLMCYYIRPSLHEQKNYFRTITPIPWIWPAKWGKWSMFKTPRSGLTWFNIIWFCIFQYCAVRVACTILAVVTQYFDRYCISSQSPLFAHIWVAIIEAIAVTIAMFCLIQFYVQLKEPLSPYGPFWKLAAIKLVIFFCFWQTFILSILTSESTNIVRPGKHVAQPDLSVGIPAICVCGEMAMFAVMHVFVYPWKPYDKNSSTSMQLENQTGEARTEYHGGPLGIKAYVDAFNPLDLVKAVGRGFRWIFVGRKTREQDVSYQKHAENNESAEEGTNLNPLSGLKKTGKYHKLDDEDDQEAPLNSSAAAMGRTAGWPAEHSGSNSSQSASNPYGSVSPDRPDAGRYTSPYEAYRSQRQSRRGTQSSVGDTLGAIPRPGEGSFEPLPVAPTSVSQASMHPSHGQGPYHTDPREDPFISQDTSYHGNDPQNPWGPNRL